MNEQLEQTLAKVILNNLWAIDKTYAIEYVNIVKAEERVLSNILGNIVVGPSNIGWDVVYTVYQDDEQRTMFVSIVDVMIYIGTNTCSH